MKDIKIFKNSFWYATLAMLIILIILGFVFWIFKIDLRMLIGYVIMVLGQGLIFLNDFRKLERSQTLSEIRQGSVIRIIIYFILLGMIAFFSIEAAILGTITLIVYRKLFFHFLIKA